MHMGQLAYMFAGVHLHVICFKFGAGHSTQIHKGRVFCPTLKKTAFTEKTGISLVEQKPKIFSLHRTLLVSLEYFNI